MASDLDTLIDMGFERARAELAVKKSGGCEYLCVSSFSGASSHTCLYLQLVTVQGALQWLEDNQDKSLEAIQAAAQDDDEDEDETKAKIAELESGQAAKSLVCNECGKLFRNRDLASYHATKTYDFMPLTSAWKCIVPNVEIVSTQTSPNQLRSLRP
jgi:hypothetical protein